MTTVRRQLLKRVAEVAAIALVFIAVITFLAVATPANYRFGIWQRLPILDHRLLPHLSAVFAAAFGAFFGSLSAFYLGRLQQRSDRRERRHTALITAQYALISQWNIVEAIRVQHLEEHRTDPSRFTKLKLYWFPVSPVFVPFADLTFVLETKDPNILHEIHLAEQSYRSCVEALQMRNRELEKFYDSPRISHQVRNFDTGAGVARASDKDLIFLKQATDALYVSVDRTLPRLVKVIQKLEKLIKTMFPGKQALRMIPESPRPDAGAPAPKTNQHT
jgi:hypothetical protein